MLLRCAEQRRGVAKLGALIIKFRDKKCPLWPQKCVPFFDPRFNTRSYTEKVQDVIYILLDLISEALVVSN